MRRKNFLKKLIVAAVTAGSLIVTPAILNLDAGNFSASVARAEIQNYTAQDTAMFDFGQHGKNYGAEASNKGSTRKSRRIPCKLFANGKRQLDEK